MKRAFASIILVPILQSVFSSTAYSQQVSGNELFSFCSKDDPYSRGKCLSYIDGVLDGSTNILDYFYDHLSESDAVIRKLIRNSKGFFCFPENVTKGQTIDVVKQYLEKHPQERHQNASDLLLISLKEAWPCVREK